MSLCVEVLELYQGFMQSQPLLGSMATASVTITTGDIASQLLIDKKVNWKKVWYTARLAPMYGAGIHALIESGDLVGKYISENPLVKSVLGPNLWGNLFNTFFFVNNTVGEKNDYSIKKLVNHYASMFSKENAKNVFKTIKCSFFAPQKGHREGGSSPI